MATANKISADEIPSPKQWVMFLVIGIAILFVYYCLLFFFISNIPDSSRYHGPQFLLFLGLFNLFAAGYSKSKGDFRILKNQIVDLENQIDSLKQELAAIGEKH